MLLVRPRSADVSCGKATLRTHPLSGQATSGTLLSPPHTPYLPLKGSVRRIGKRERESPVDKRSVDGVGRNR